MSKPALPVFTLENGPWRAEVFDPRADPLALGARYVHGGYVRALWRGEHQLTGRVGTAWDRFDGEGLPETFETGLGWAAAPLNEEFLRIGAGRLRRISNMPRESMAHAPLVTSLEWTIVNRSKAMIEMATEDEAMSGLGTTYGYRLTRRVVLTPDGVDSTTTLTLSAEHWQGHVLAWYAHPFFAQDAVDQTAIAFPGQPTVSGPLVRGDDGWWRMTTHNGRAVASGLWGEREAIVARLSPPAGGGRISMQLDRPLDHAVVFATRRCCSVEPKLAKAMTHGETATWTIAYRWLEP